MNEDTDTPLSTTVTDLPDGSKRVSVRIPEGTVATLHVPANGFPHQYLDQNGKPFVPFKLSKSIF